MTETISCDSCTMPIESGALCQYCADDKGALRPFDEVFERMVQWTLKQNADLPRDKAEHQTIEFMSGMPAWRTNKDVLARKSG